MTKITTLLIFAVLCGCTPIYERWRPDPPPEPKTKYACVDNTCRAMTRKEFDVWIRDQQMRGAL